MTVAGIVAEYNPFHSGHLWHMEQTRRALGADTAIVCVMSGGFVQRGEWAVFSKFARAEAAARCGADVVLELPAAKALCSAEGFARGAVEVLEATGVVDCLSFGSECGDLALLERAARALMEPATDELIKRELASGVSYAAARQRALAQTAGEDAAAVSRPNDILAVEYIKAVYYLRSRMEPFTVARRGARHDERGTSELPSASELRARLAAGRSISAYVPSAANEVYRREARQGRGPVSADRMETALLSRLRMLPPESFAALAGASEGLENRLCRAARTEPTLDGVLAAAGTKRYAMSRLRRMLMCAAIGITAADTAADAPYIRVLAATARGRELLREMDGRSALPVITKPASVKKLDESCRRCFELECAADDLLALGCPAPQERRAGADWLTTPVML